MLDTNTSILVITLIVNGLNAPIKRWRLSEYIKKQDPTICCLQETDFKYTYIYKLKVNKWTNIYVCMYVNIYLCVCIYI